MTRLQSPFYSSDDAASFGSAPAADSVPDGLCTALRSQLSPMDTSFMAAAPASAGIRDAQYPSALMDDGESCLPWSACALPTCQGPLPLGETWNCPPHEPGFSLDSPEGLYSRRFEHDIDMNAFPPSVFADPHQHDLSVADGVAAAQSFLSVKDDPIGVDNAAVKSPSSPQTEADRSPVDKEQPYAQLIYRALMAAPGRTMILRDIYDWFRVHTDKATDKETKGWQNSIRHNLSMNGVRPRSPLLRQDV